MASHIDEGNPRSVLHPSRSEPVLTRAFTQGLVHSMAASTTQASNKKRRHQKAFPQDRGGGKVSAPKRSCAGPQDLGTTTCASDENLRSSSEPSPALADSLAATQEGCHHSHQASSRTTGENEIGSSQLISPLLPGTPTIDYLGLPPPESPPPYTFSAAMLKRSWHEDEDNYLKYLMECELTWPQRYKKFKARFGEIRSEMSLSARSSKLEKDCPRFLQRKIQSKWSLEETAVLRSLVPAEDDWQGVIEKFQERLGHTRTGQQIKSKAWWESRQGKRKAGWPSLDTSHLDSQERWTDEQHEFLVSLKQTGVDRSKWVECMRDKFDVERTLDALTLRLSHFGLLDHTWDVWTAEEEDFMADCIATVNRGEVCDLFWEAFGTQRSESSIWTKWAEMKKKPGYRTNNQGIFWTTAEDNLIREWTGNFTGLMAAYKQQFGDHRTEDAMRGRLLKMRRNKIEPSN
jgi:hypothetical protein